MRNDRACQSVRRAQPTPIFLFITANRAVEISACLNPNSILQKDQKYSEEPQKKGEAGFHFNAKTKQMDYFDLAFQSCKFSLVHFQREKDTSILLFTRSAQLNRRIHPITFSVLLKSQTSRFFFHPASSSSADFLALVVFPPLLFQFPSLINQLTNKSPHQPASRLTPRPGDNTPSFQVCFLSPIPKRKSYFP